MKLITDKEMSKAIVLLYQRIGPNTRRFSIQENTVYEVGLNENVLTIAEICSNFMNKSIERYEQREMEQAVSRRDNHSQDV